MHAQPGDQIVVESQTLDVGRRRGEVLAVMGSEDTEHYQVRWADGHESVFFPGPNARVESGG